MKHIALVLIMIFYTLSIKAQNNETNVLKNLSVSGNFDGYYRTNINAPNDNNQIAPATAFADKSGFSLGMVNIIGTYTKNKVGAVADIVFGPRGEQASSTVINQLSLFWNVSDKVKLTFGKFNTFVGYELISPVDNFNYSTSYLFSNGPFSHTGLKADFALSEKASLMLAVMNQTDVTEYNPDGSYAIGLQLGYSDQFLNVLYDDAGLGIEIDYTGGFDLDSKLFLGINGAYTDNDGEGFTGAALYPQYSVSEKLSIGLRGEYFQTLSKTIAETHVIATTLTGNYKVDNLTIKPELRLDSGKDDIFIDNKLNPNKVLSSFLIGAVYHF